MILDVNILVSLKSSFHVTFLRVIWCDVNHIYTMFLKFSDLHRPRSAFGIDVEYQGNRWMVPAITTHLLGRKCSKSMTMLDKLSSVCSVSEKVWAPAVLISWCSREGSVLSPGHSVNEGKGRVSLYRRLNVSDLAPWCICCSDLRYLFKWNKSPLHGIHSIFKAIQSYTPTL